MSWITTEETAELLDYHVERVRQLAREGKLEARKFGHVWLIDHDAAHELAERLKSYSKRDPRRGSEY